MDSAFENKPKDPQRQSPPLSRPYTLAHISDLHIGKSLKLLRIAEEIHAALSAAMVDLTIVTGDITEHGRDEEYDFFKDTFGDLIAQGRLLALPGNHDRWGNDIGRDIMNGERIQTVSQAGVHLIRVDSTEPRNRIRISGHGMVTEDMMNTIERTIKNAADDVLVVLALHHHLLPQPEDLWIEKLSNWLYLPFAKELRAGKELIERLHGECNLVLHGHRHSLKETFFQQHRLLGIYNAGSTTRLGGFRIFTHQNGAIIGEPRWISVR